MSALKRIWNMDAQALLDGPTTAINIYKIKIKN